MSFGQLRLRYEAFITGHGQYVEKQKTQREGTMWDEAVPWDGDKEKEICAVAPPLECFMNIPDNIKKQHFFQSIAMHDYFIGEVAAVHETGLILKLLCMDGGMARDLEACKLLAAISLRNIPILQAHSNPLDGFQVTDKVRAFIIDKDGPTQRIWASLNPSDLPSHLLDVQLGLISDEDMPAHFRAMNEANNRSFEQCLMSMPQYNNSGGVEHICEKLGIDLRKPVSLMHTINKLKIEPHQYADELRKKQMSKLALKHVTKGVDYFRSKKHTEAMQCFNFALTVDANHVEGLVARGALYATLSTYKKAMEDLERALELEPSHKNAINYLSQVLVVYGREVMKSENAWSKADAYFRRALKMNPWMDEAKEALYDLYKEEQKHKIAPKSRTSDEGSQDEAGKSTSDVTRAQRLLLKLVNSDEKKNLKASRRTEADYNAWEESDEEKDTRDSDLARRRKKRGSSLPRTPSPHAMYSPNSPTKVDSRSPTKMPKFDLYRNFGSRKDEKKPLSPFDKRDSASLSRGQRSQSPRREIAPERQKTELSSIDWLAPFRDKTSADKPESSQPPESRRDMRFISRSKEPEPEPEPVPVPLPVPVPVPVSVPVPVPVPVPEPVPVPKTKTVTPPPPAPPSLMDIDTGAQPPAPAFPSFVPTLRPVVNIPDFTVPPPMIFQNYPPPIMPPVPQIQPALIPPASSSLIPQTSSIAPGLSTTNTVPSSSAPAAPKKSHPFMRKNAAASAAASVAASVAAAVPSSMASKIKVAEATLDTADAMMRSALSGGLTVSASGDGGRRVISYRPKDKVSLGEGAKDEEKPRNYRRRSVSRSPPRMKPRPERPPPRRRGGRGVDDYDYEAEVNAFLNRIRPSDDKRARRRSRSRSPDRGPRRKQRSSSSERRRYRRSRGRSRERVRSRERDWRRARDRSRELARNKERGRSREHGRDSDRSVPEVMGRHSRGTDNESPEKKDSKRQPPRRKLFMPTEKEYQELTESVTQQLPVADVKGKPQVDISRLNKTIRGIEERVRSRRDDDDESSDHPPRYPTQPQTRPMFGPRGSSYNQPYMRPRFPYQTRAIRPQRPAHQRPPYQPQGHVNQTGAERPQNSSAEKPQNSSVERPQNSSVERPQNSSAERPQNSNMSGNPSASINAVQKSTSVNEDSDVMIIDPPKPDIPKPAPIPQQPQSSTTSLDPPKSVSLDDKVANGVSADSGAGTTKESEGGATKKKKPVRSLAEFDKFMKTLKGKKK